MPHEHRHEMAGDGTYHGSVSDGCAVCAGDEGGGSVEQRLAHLARTAVGHVASAEFGFSVCGVFGSETQPAWAYTSGLSYRAGGAWIGVPVHPEVLFCGASNQGMQGLARQFGDDVLRAGLRLEDGDVLAGFLGRGYLLAARAVDPARVDVRDRFGFGLRVRARATGAPMDEPYPALHLVMQDKERRFPWDAGCGARWRAGQALEWQDGPVVAAASHRPFTARRRVTRLGDGEQPETNTFDYAPLAAPL